MHHKDFSSIERHSLYCWCPHELQRIPQASSVYHRLQLSLAEVSVAPAPLVQAYKSFSATGTDGRDSQVSEYNSQTLHWTLTLQLHIYTSTEWVD